MKKLITILISLLLVSFVIGCSAPTEEAMDDAGDAMDDDGPGEAMDDAGDAMGDDIEGELDSYEDELEIDDLSGLGDEFDV